jgi:hypothetical protein
MQSDTPASYSEFLKRHPEGAKAKLATARTAALIEQNQWLRTIEKPTQSGLNAFLRDNPGSIWVDEARAALERLASQQLQNEPEPQSLDQQSGNHESEPIPAAVEAAVKAVSEPQPPTQLQVSKAQVQLGAFKSRDAALSALDAAKAVSSGLRTSEPQLDIIKLKGQQLFRVRAGVPSIQQAASICQEITRTGSSCLVVKK